MDTTLCQILKALLPCPRPRASAVAPALCPLPTALSGIPTVCHQSLFARGTGEPSRHRFPTQQQNWIRFPGETLQNKGDVNAPNSEAKTGELRPDRSSLLLQTPQAGASEDGHLASVLKVGDLLLQQ